MSTLAAAGGTMGPANGSESNLYLPFEVEVDFVDEVLQSLAGELGLNLGKHCLCIQS